MHSAMLGKCWPFLAKRRERADAFSKKLQAFGKNRQALRDAPSFSLVRILKEPRARRAATNSVPQAGGLGGASDVSTSSRGGCSVGGLLPHSARQDFRLRAEMACPPKRICEHGREPCVSRRSSRNWAPSHADAFFPNRSRREHRAH